jgi:hypothetical protein
MRSPPTLRTDAVITGTLAGEVRERHDVQVVGRIREARLLK